MSKSHPGGADHIQRLTGPRKRTTEIWRKKESRIQKNCFFEEAVAEKQTHTEKNLIQTFPFGELDMDRGMRAMSVFCWKSKNYLRHEGSPGPQHHLVPMQTQERVSQAP